MAATPQFDGPVLVKVDTGGSNALESLGYTEDGADVAENPFYLDVHGDQNGGSDGPPIDIQWLGETARIRLVLTSFDSAVLAKLRPFIYGGTAGTPGTPGTLMFTGTKTFRVLLSPTTDPQNFTRCVLREAVEFNKGVKFKKVTLVFEAHKDANGVLFNATTS